MKYISLREFAQERHITYEAARRVAAKYHDRLRDNIVMNGNTRMYDEDAVAFMDEMRKKSPVVVRLQTDSDKAEELSAEVESLRTKLLQVQDELLSARKELLLLADARAERTLLLEEQKRQQEKLVEVTADRDRLERERDSVLTDLEGARTETRAAQAERDSAKLELEQIQTDRDTAKADLDRIQAELQAAQAAKEEAETEANRYHKSWFGFYRRH